MSGLHVSLMLTFATAIPLLVGVPVNSVRMLGMAMCLWAVS